MYVHEGKPLTTFAPDTTGIGRVEKALIGQ
jgi:hypothetical protein